MNRMYVHLLISIDIYFSSYIYIKDTHTHRHILEINISSDTTLRSSQRIDILYFWYVRYIELIKFSLMFAKLQKRHWYEITECICQLKTKQHNVKVVKFYLGPNENYSPGNSLWKCFSESCSEEVETEVSIDVILMKSV